MNVTGDSYREALGANLGAKLDLIEPAPGKPGPQADIITNTPELSFYERDLAEIPPGLTTLLQPSQTPHLALQPGSSDEIAAAVAWAHSMGLPVVPRGISSSAYGGAVPSRGGLLIDMVGFRRIEAVDFAAMTVRVQAGVSWGDLEKYLNEHGLTVYTYPSSRFSTVGGWVATGGLGINAFKYGHLRNWITALDVIHPDGTAETLTPGSPAFDKFIGTEGQMGVITGVTLKVRPLPEFTMPHLFAFERPVDVSAFVEHLIVRGVTPAHVKLLDRRQMANLNALHREDHPEREGLVEERDAVFLHMDDAQDEADLQAMLADFSLPFDEAPRYVAGVLWNERFFPMKLKRFGPSLLAAQVVMPLDGAAAFIEEAAVLGARFGVTTATESYVAKRADGGYEVLAMPMYPCDARKLSYVFHLLLSQLIVWMGIRRGGRPYAAGLWNSAFVQHKYGRDKYRDLVAYKRRVDPDGLVNPGKLEGARGVLGLLFNRSLFPLVLTLCMALGGVIGALARWLHRGAERPPVAKSHHYDPIELAENELEEVIRACTGCGDCLPVCPAYLVTGDEAVTGRAKLRTGLQMLAGERIDQTVSDKTFLCMYCKACQDVCQSSLPLISAYESIEAGLAAQNGRPDALIADFIAEAESREDYFTFIGTRKFPEAEPELAFVTQAAESAGDEPKPAPDAIILEDEIAVPGELGALAQKYHIEVAPAESRREPIGKFTIDRADYCINCGQCTRACLYGVHQRDPLDIRKLAEPEDTLCRNCFRCVQECPVQALTMGHSEIYAGVGRGIYTPDGVHSLATQAERGQIPVRGQGYRGAFSGPGFDGMWTDMSEIVRPTRDGIHGREYISTAVTLGARLTHLNFDAAGGLQSDLPPTVSIPYPVLFDLSGMVPGDSVMRAVIDAAREVGTLAVVDAGTAFDAANAPFVASHVDAGGSVPPGVRLALVDGAAQALDLAAAQPELVVGVRVDLDEHAPDAVVELARAGVALAYLVGEDGTALDPAVDAPNIVTLLPAVHDRLVEAGLRDRITLVARGGIAQAEHLPKAMILGADAVAIDWPLLIALECRLEGSCVDGEHICGLDQRAADKAWAAQRIVNLMASWHSQFLEVLGAMGLREARRLRGERGRAMFARDLEKTSFADILRDSGVTEMREAL